MLAKLKLAGPVAAFLAASALLFSACSSSHPRDISYGTDAGLDFVPPDGGTTSSIDTSGAIDVSVGSEAGATNASASNDAGDQVDVSIDTNN